MTVSSLSTSYLLRKRMDRFGLHLLALVLSLMFLIPFVVCISASLSNETALSKHGFSLLPQQFTSQAYQVIFKVPQDLFRSYGVTFFVTIAGTLLSLLVMTPCAYALSRRENRFRNLFSFLIFFTMVFSGGLVPWYILVKQYLHLGNTIWVMVVPFLVNGWTIIILRSNFRTLPQDILDSAKIDGADEWGTLFQIAIPMAAPTLAAVGIFLALGFWNTYFPALMFIDDRKLFPLQYLLYIMQTNLEIFTQHQNLIGIPIPMVSVRFAMVVLIGAPVVLFTLFFQKYFIKGVYMGSVKE